VIVNGYKEDDDEEDDEGRPSVSEERMYLVAKGWE
jgi:hypothetical protein